MFCKLSVPTPVVLVPTLTVSVPSTISNGQTSIITAFLDVPQNDNVNNWETFNAGYSIISATSPVAGSVTIGNLGKTITVISSTRKKLESRFFISFEPVPSGNALVDVDISATRVGFTLRDQKSYNITVV